MAQCPRCREDMPLLSKICTVCGHVAEGEHEDNVSVEEFVNKLEKSLHEIKQIPQPSFGKSMGQLTFIMYPLLALVFLATALWSEAGAMWILFGIFLVLSIYAIYKKRSGKLGNDPFNRKFTELKSEYDYNQRVAKRSFGKSREVSTLLDEISAEMHSIEKKRKAGNSRNALIWIVILAVFVALITVIVVLPSKPVDPKQEVERLVEGYKSAGYDKDDKAPRLELLKSALEMGESAAAESFFVESCMGNIGDYDCAELIVKHYAGKGETEAASKFIESCTKMRYASDKGKLNSLLNR